MEEVFEIYNNYYNIKKDVVRTERVEIAHRIIKLIKDGEHKKALKLYIRNFY